MSGETLAFKRLALFALMSLWLSVTYAEESVREIAKLGRGRLIETRGLTATYVWLDHPDCKNKSLLTHFNSYQCLGGPDQSTTVICKVTGEEFVIPKDGPSREFQANDDRCKSSIPEGDRFSTADAISSWNFEPKLAFGPEPSKASHTVYALVDPSEEFSKRLISEWRAIAALGIRIQTAVYSRYPKGTPEWLLAASVLCAADPKSALEAVARGKSVPTVECAAAEDRLTAIADHFPYEQMGQMPAVFAQSGISLGGSELPSSFAQRLKMDEEFLARVQRKELEDLLKKVPADIKLTYKLGKPTHTIVAFVDPTDEQSRKLINNTENVLKLGFQVVYVPYSRREMFASIACSDYVRGAFAKAIRDDSLPPRKCSIAEETYDLIRRHASGQMIAFENGKRHWGAISIQDIWKNAFPTKSFPGLPPKPLKTDAERIESLRRELISAARANQPRETLAVIDQLVLFEFGGVPLPPPVLLMEGRASLLTGDNLRAQQALGSFLRLVSTDDPSYEEAEKLYQQAQSRSKNQSSQKASS